MANIFLKLIFFLINLVFSLVVSPFVSVISSMFPTLGTAIEQATTYFNTILQFVPLALELFMIPRLAIKFVFDYLIIKYAIYLIVVVIKCAINIYEKFKP